MQLLQTLSWAYKDGDFYENCYKLVKSVKNIKKKKTHNLFKKWSLDLWWISNKTIMEVGNITKDSTFKSFFHLSYKNTQLLFFVIVFFNIFHEKKIKQWFWRVTQKYEYMNCVFPLSAFLDGAFCQTNTAFSSPLIFFKVQIFSFAGRNTILQQPPWMF